MLCHICQAIDFKPLAAFQQKYEAEELPKASSIKFTLRGPFYYPHQPSAVALRSSRSSGCHLCSQIWFSFGGLESYVPETGRFWLDYRLLGDGSVPRAIRVSCIGTYSTPFLDLTPLGTIPLPLRVTNPLIDSSTGSDDNLELARSWLDECFKNHEDCSIYQGGQAVLPTRVIDVTSPKLHLHVSNGEIGKYAILSHCWGKHPIATTTESNIERRCGELSFHELSNTFRDAVAITRALHLPYLWIDSICIVQNSPCDWEIESPQMGKYYASARVTIAAMDAQDGSIGCFVDRNPLQTQPCLLQIKLNGRNDRVSVITSQSPRHKSRTGELNRTPRFMSLLASRAWCLQETIMSPRMLSFGLVGMSWTCLRGRLFEGQITLKYTDPSVLEADFFRKLHDFKALINDAGPLCKQNIWFDIVEQYTQRSLTFSSDMLPGLSGLAGEIQSVTQDNYLAGIWERDLPRGLLWRTPSQIAMKQGLLSKTTYDDPRIIPFSERSMQYRAPSWSWACIDHGFVNWDHVRDLVTLDNEFIAGVDPDEDKHAETCFESMSASVHLLGLNPFGQVKDASLLVRGMLKSADVWAWEEGVEGRYIDDPNLIDPVSKSMIGRIDADDVNWVERAVWCLPIMRHVKDDGDEGKQVHTLSLALVPDKLREGCYTRIGVAVIKEGDWFAGCEMRDLVIL